MNRTPLTAASIALAALALAGCNNTTQGGPAVANFCPNFKTASTNTSGPLAVTDPNGAAADECVRRWAYSMAPSRDSASMVAEASISACAARLGAWNQAGLSQFGGGAPPAEAVSIITGQPTNPVAEHNSFLRGRALLYVVQARAGHCAPPAIVNGAPSGA